MFNGRLYFQAWVLATVALLVAFLTLRAPDPQPQSTQPVQFPGSATRDLAVRFQEAAPLRVPGSVGAAAAEKWVIEQFTLLAGTDRSIGVDRAVVRRANGDVPFTNVSFTVPARALNRSQRRILVVAPRDAPRQVTGGTSSTALLVQLAALALQARYHHPVIFLSVDADTYGNAGLRRYLSRENPSRFAGVIVLDAPAEGLDSIPVRDPATGLQRLDPVSGQPLTEPNPDASTIYLWSSGSGKQSLDMRRMAEKAVAAAGFEASPMPSLRRQLLGLSFTETRGAQRAAIDRGIPAITLSGRPEAVLPVGVPEISRTRMRASGNAALALIGLLDDRERAQVPDRALAYAGRILRPSVARLALLFLAFPIFVAALDAALRVRRSRVRLSTGNTALGWRTLPVVVGLVTGWLLMLWGVLRRPEVGRPPSPADLPFDGESALALLLITLSVVAMWLFARPRFGISTSGVSAQSAAALLWLSVAVLLAWWQMPYALVLILPLAHAAVVATIAPRLWQIILVALLGLAPLVAQLMRLADITDLGLASAAWYIVQTTVSGARGLLGPVVAGLVLAAIGALAGATVARVREGLVESGDVRKGLRWLTSNLSARKRPVGARDGEAAQKT